MPRKKKYELENCRFCGAPAKEKIVSKPFSHGWVGCEECNKTIYWTGGGHMSAVDQWNDAQMDR